MGVSLQIRTKLLDYYSKSGSWIGGIEGNVDYVFPAEGRAQVLYIVEAVIDDGLYNLTPQSGTIRLNQRGTASGAGFGTDNDYDVNRTKTYNFESAFNETKFSGGTVTVELFRVVHKFDVLGGITGSFGTINVRATYTTGTSAGTLATSYSHTISYSNPATGSAIEAAHGILGVSQAIGVTKPVDCYVKVKYTCAGNGSETTGWIFGDSNNYTTIIGPDGPELMYKDVYTSTEWTPPLDLARHFPTTDKINVVFTTYTYDSDHNVKSIDYDTRTYILPDTYIPSCNLTVTDSLGYYDKYGAFVAGKSKYAVDIDAEGVYGSYITRYHTLANNQTFNESDFVTNALIPSGGSLVRTTITDSRGRNVTVRQEFRVIDYTVPKVTSLDAIRCNKDGTPNNTGEYIKVTFSATVSPLNDLNECYYFVNYKKTTDPKDKYNTDTLMEYTNQYSVTDAVHIFKADAGASYNIVVAISDDLEMRYRSTSGSSGAKLLSFLSKGIGIAIGKIAELAEYLDIGWTARFRKGIELDNAQTLSGIATDGSSVAMLHLDANDNTEVMGNKITLSASSGIYVNGRLLSATPGLEASSLLWAGEWYMKEDQTAILSEQVTAQLHGIALVWSYYSYPTVHDADFQITYIPKELIAFRDTTEISVLLKSVSQGYIGSKRLIVSDTAVMGHSHNDNDAVDSVAGYTDNPQKFVLRYVIGV